MHRLVGSKELPYFLTQTIDTIIKTVNYIKASVLRNRLFKNIYEKNGS